MKAYLTRWTRFILKKIAEIDACVSGDMLSGINGSLRFDSPALSPVGTCEGCQVGQKIFGSAVPPGLILSIL